jgi:hypothetical protein
VPVEAERVDVAAAGRRVRRTSGKGFSGQATTIDLIALHNTKASLEVGRRDFESLVDEAIN